MDEKEITSNELNKIIDKLHWKSFDKVWKHIQEKFPEVKKDKVKKVWDKRLKDMRDAEKKQRSFWNPVFSNHYYSYLMDLVENKQGFIPRYWFMFINVNTRYAFAYEMERKTEAEVKRVLNEFIDKEKVSTLTGDDESAFSSKGVVDLLTKKSVGLRIVVEQQHGALSILDRFIPRLRLVLLMLTGSALQLAGE